MKKSRNFYRQLIGIPFLFVVGLLCINAGMGGPSTNQSAQLEPKFVPLAEGEGSFIADVYDPNGNRSCLKDLSFFGHTKLAGVKEEKEGSPFDNTIDLAQLTELHIEDPGFESKVHSDGEYVLASVSYSNGKVFKNLLIPRHVVICGIDCDTGMERAAFLSRLDKIIMREETDVTKLDEDRTNKKRTEALKREHQESSKEEPKDKTSRDVEKKKKRKKENS